MGKLLALVGLLVLGGVVAWVVVGRGSDRPVSLGAPPDHTTTVSTPSTTLPAAAPAVSFEAWFARGARLVPTVRIHARTTGVARVALIALLRGPNSAERRSGLESAIPGGTRLLGVAVKAGVATVDLTSEYQSGGGSLSMQLRLAQVVYTATQFPTVKTVRFELDGQPVNVFSGEGIVLDRPVGRDAYRDLSAVAAPVAGTWRMLPSPAAKPEAYLTGIWTGKELIVSGLGGVAPDGNLLNALNVAAAYDPATNRWRQRPGQPGPRDYGGNRTAVWTGTEMLARGSSSAAFDPRSGAWRRLPPAPAGDGLVVWSGHELLGWGGGCCGDASADGAAYDPARNHWRKLAPGPLPPSQHPAGAWTGNELIVVAGSHAAAYDPAVDGWQRLASPPAPRDGADAVWDGRELLLVGGTVRGVPARVGVAYDPATNRWRLLPPMDAGRVGAAAVWTGKRLLVWGGSISATSSVAPPHGLSYDPRTNRWSPLRQAPLAGRMNPVAVWTGRSLVVWGGSRAACARGGVRGCHTEFLGDGAAFTPAP